MRIGRHLFGISIALSTTGCLDLVPQRFQLAAEPLMDAPGTPEPPRAGATAPWPSSLGVPASHGGTTPSAFQWAYLLVQDSQKKCAAYVNSMFAQNAAWGLGLDVLNTTTSALATVFTPLATVHALTAASTIFGAARTSITAEYLNSLTISHITKAIQTTYNKDMDTYAASLGALSSTQRDSIDIFQERSRILRIHNECSLAAAEGSISGALQQEQATGAQTPVSLIYKVGQTPGDSTSLAALTLAILAAITSDSAFGNAGVTALPGSGVGLISFKTGAVYTFTAKAGPSGATETANIVNDSNLKIGGTPRVGDTITITAAPAAKQSSGGSPPSKLATPAKG